MLREIVLDTETTGLDAAGADRLVEIGCVEIVNRIPTGREYHCYVNPEREVPADAVRIHGLTTEFLKDKPKFKDIAQEFLAFVGDAPLVIHNATFDAGFLTMELERLGLSGIDPGRLVDTLAIARRRHPGQPNNLDVLCKRYGIDNSKRTKHGALMDSLLLAAVYVELIGERQARLELAGGPASRETAAARRTRAAVHQRPAPLPPRLTPDDEAAHRAFVETLGARAIWKRFGR